MKTKDCICMPLCVKHDCPRPCSICDKELFDKKNNWLEERKSNSKSQNVKGSGKQSGETPKGLRHSKLS